MFFIVRMVDVIVGQRQLKCWIGGHLPWGEKGMACVYVRCERYCAQKV